MCADISGGIHCQQCSGWFEHAQCIVVPRWLCNCFCRQLTKRERSQPLLRTISENLFWKWVQVFESAKTRKERWLAIEDCFKRLKRRHQTDIKHHVSHRITKFASLAMFLVCIAHLLTLKQKGVLYLDDMGTFYQLSSRWAFYKVKLFRLDGVAWLLHSKLDSRRNVTAFWQQAIVEPPFASDGCTSLKWMALAIILNN